MTGSEPPSAREPLASVRAFYESTPRYDYASSVARRREEMSKGGATAELLDGLRRCFPAGAIPAALEVGGEYATTLQVLRERFQIAEAVSCDLVLPSVQAPGIRYEKLSAEELASAFPPAAFDLVLLIDVIEHLYDPDVVVEQVRKVLRPNGVLAIVTPNLASWINRALLVTGHQPLDAEVSTRGLFGRPGPKGAPPAGHIRVFTRRALGEFLGFHRYEVVEDRFSPLGFSHPTYVAADGAPARRPSDGNLGAGVGWVVRIDSVVSKAFPSLASRLIVLARPQPVDNALRRPSPGTT